MAVQGRECHNRHAAERLSPGPCATDPCATDPADPFPGAPWAWKAVDWIVFS